MSALSTLWPQLRELFAGLLPLSMLAIGGAVTVIPAMHALTVNKHGWLADTEFSASVAIAQAAPGPNILFVPLVGWHVGLTWASQSAGSSPLAGYALGLVGALTALLGITLPSSLMSYFAGRWIHAHNEQRAVRAFKAGMAPIVLALLIAAGWILASQQVRSWQDWHTAVLCAAAALLVWRSKVHLLVLLAGGAVLGVMGWV